MKYEVEYWDSLDSKYVILVVEAPSKKDAERIFRELHPHKKYRVLDPLDD